MPLPPADPVFGSVGKKADVNLYLRKVATQEAVHPQHVYVMIAGEVVPAGPKPEIDLLYDEMKGKGVFEGVEGDTQPANTEYSGYRQFDVVDSTQIVSYRSLWEVLTMAISAFYNSASARHTMRASARYNDFLVFAPMIQQCNLH